MPTDLPGLAGRAIVLFVLLALTGWNFTRSAALAEAEAAYRRGEHATAVRRAEDHLARRPWSRPAARIAALGLSRLDFADLAEPYYRRAGELGLDELHVRAYGLVRANRRTEAEEVYRVILARRPDDRLALRRLGAELITMMRWPEALELAERLAATPDGEVDGLAMIGAIQHHDDKAAAAAAYRRILEIDPSLRRLPSDPGFRRVFWTQLTEELIATGEPAEARRLLDLAPAADRGPTWHWLLGRVHLEEGSLEQAEAAWGAAVHADPGLTEAWIELGRLALARNRPAQAIPHLQRAFALDPRSYASAHLLATTYKILGRDDLAEHYRTEPQVHDPGK